MGNAPYEHPIQDNGELCFVADVPALAHIGRRFDELSEKSTHYVASEQEKEQWRQLVRRLEQLTAEAGRKAAKPWAETERQLEREFPDAFIPARNRVPHAVQVRFASGKLPLAEYLESLRDSAEQMATLTSGSGLEGMIGALESRLKQIGKCVQSSMAEREDNSAPGSDDAKRREFMARSLNMVLQSMNDPDPQAHQRMIVEQMKMFRESPFFEQAQQGQREMRQQLERLRDTHPDLYKRQMEEMDRMERFNTDPEAAIREMMAAAPAAEAPNAEAGESDRSHAGPGQLLFRCGRRKQVTPAQIQLFEEFLRDQDRLRPQIEAALREMHGWAGDAESVSLPGDRLLFPANPDATDIPLQCFQIRHANLGSDGGGRIVLHLDTLFGHFDEHGCSILIENGAVERYGTWDDVFGDEDFDEAED